MAKKKGLEPDDSAALRVGRGILLLDVVRPDWRKALNLDALVLSSCVACVLGQLFGDYDKGLRALDLTRLDAFNYGFNTMNSKMEHELVQEWTRVASS